MYESALILSFSLLLDQILGEPRKYHPLVGFGWCVNNIEKALNRKNKRRIKGLLGVLILILPLILLVLSLRDMDFYWLLEIVIVYLAIGRKSLIQHAKAVEEPLIHNDIENARTRVSYIVSRDTNKLEKKGIITATIESIVENSNDAIFAAIFWYMLAGVPGILCYRLVNTLDAIWGYKNSRFLEFGWAAAKLDDVMNWIPARLTVLTFALLSTSYTVLKTAFIQGALCSSPNAGPVMAAGASSLNIKLGGDAFYQQQLIAKPVLGYGNEPEVKDIKRALILINRSLYLWLGFIFAAAILIEVI